jgi:hypothetical protein
MAWFKRFHDPIVLSDGRELLTCAMPPNTSPRCRKAEQEATEWQVAMESYC